MPNLDCTKKTDEGTVAAAAIEALKDFKNPYNTSAKAISGTKDDSRLCQCN